MKFNEYFKLRDVTLNITNNCNLRCPYCVSGDTQITMSDLTVKPIKDIKIGDEIIAFNEFSEKNKQRKLKTAKVTHVFNPRYVEKLYQIKTYSGNKLLITEEHPILDGRNKWTTAEKLINKKEKKIKSVKLPKFNIRIDGIKSIEEIDFNDYVYNIETTEHTYIANNILVHNCFENNKNDLKMSIENVEKILDKCYENYLLTNDGKFPFVVNFFGGEPFLNFEVIEHAMKYASEKKYNMSFGVTTNLTILNEHMIDVIEEYELGILVSIDGIKEIHDRNRCNSYDKVKENVEKLINRHLGYLIEARMTILPEDVNELLNSIKSIVDMGIVNIAPVPVTDVFWSAEQLMNLYKNLNIVWDWLFDIYNDNENKKNITIKFIEDYIENVLMIPLNDYQTKVCSAGTFTSCSIGVNGDILPCHQRHAVSYKYRDLVMGNIFNDNDIKEIEFNNGTISGAYDCDDCIAKSVCKGGCPSENLTVNGNGNKMNEIQCMINIVMVTVAYEHQLNLLNCSNIRSHRLNILAQNISLLNYLFEEVLTKNPITQEYAVSLLTFYEKIIDMEDIILPNFNEVLKKVVQQLVNINKEIMDMDKGKINEL